jgi:L-2,4-diaminobutyric acid acetyltransferase
MAAPAVSLRPPIDEDARAVHELAFSCGNLDVNSRYAYLLVCSHFAMTSIVAEINGTVVGFISGYRLPEQPDTLFIWQVAVAPEHRGRGIAAHMLESLVERLMQRGLRFVEATITPDNASSRRLFWGLARRRLVGCTESEGFAPALFLPETHDAEPLIRIGPLPVTLSQTTQLQKGTL